MLCFSLFLDFSFYMVCLQPYIKHNFATTQHQKRGNIHRYFPCAVALICCSLLELQKEIIWFQKAKKINNYRLLTVRKYDIRYIPRKNLLKLFICFHLQVFSLKDCTKAWYITIGMFVSSHKLTLRCTEKYGHPLTMCNKPHADSNNTQNNAFHLGF